MTTPTPEEKLAAEMYPTSDLVPRFRDDERAAFLHGLRLGKAEGDEKGYARAKAEDRDGGRQLAFDRDTLGRMVREAWVRWAETQPSPKPSWLVPYDDLDERDKEADRQIGEAIARWALIGDAANRALSPTSPAPGAGERVEDYTELKELEQALRSAATPDKE